MSETFQKYLASFIKHSAWAALCVLILYSARTDFLLPLMRTMDRMADTMKDIERGQDRLLYHTVKGSWRATDPPEEAPAVGPEPPMNGQP